MVVDTGDEAKTTRLGQHHAILKRLSYGDYSRRGRFRDDAARIAVDGVEGDVEGREMCGPISHDKLERIIPSS
jgi:hypothetical protein